MQVNLQFSMFSFDFFFYWFVVKFIAICVLRRGINTVRDKVEAPQDEPSMVKDFLCI